MDDKLKTKLFIGAMVQEARRFENCRRAVNARDYSAIPRATAILDMADYYAKYGSTVKDYGK